MKNYILLQYFIQNILNRANYYNEMINVKLDNDEIINKVNLKFKEIGFKYVTLDLNGYKMGSMN